MVNATMNGAAGGAAYKTLFNRQIVPTAEGPKLIYTALQMTPEGPASVWLGEAHIKTLAISQEVMNAIQQDLAKFMQEQVSGIQIAGPGIVMAR